MAPSILRDLLLCKDRCIGIVAVFVAIVPFVLKVAVDLVIVPCHLLL